MDSDLRIRSHARAAPEVSVSLFLLFVINKMMQRDAVDALNVWMNFESEWTLNMAPNGDRNKSEIHLLLPSIFLALKIISRTQS